MDTRRFHFRYPLNAENLAHLLGMEREDMHRQLEQMRDEPAGHVSADEAGLLVLSLDGLPTLIKQMAFNIPTTDIIENLTCQVLHLAAMHEDFDGLQGEIQQAQAENGKLGKQIAVLQQENTALASRLDELLNQGFRERLSGLFRRTG